MIIDKSKLIGAMLVMHPHAVAASSISRICGCPEHCVADCLSDMSRDNDPYGPLVEQGKMGWRIAGRIGANGSTGGWAYIEECIANPRLSVDLRQFTDEVLTGIRSTGKRSTIKNAVLHGPGKRQYKNAERAAHATNRRFEK